MPRVILRTVEPAKLLACQSVEKRCTRMNASRDTSDMIRSVNGTIACSPASRRIIDTRPSDTIAMKAVSAAWRAAGSDAPEVMASTRRPENTGMNRSATVAPSRPRDDGRGEHRLMQPVTKHEGQHHTDRGGALVELSGHGVIRLRARAGRLHCLTGGGQRPARTRR